MFRGFVNIWNYFSENVTALRMRDNCWGVTQRRSALPLATNGTQERGDGSPKGLRRFSERPPKAFGEL